MVCTMQATSSARTRERFEDPEQLARNETSERHESAWIRAHQTLSRLARERASADAEEGRWLLAALRSAAHVHLGFGSFGEYVCHEAWEGPMT
jgi:hypothetical protein